MSRSLRLFRIWLIISVEVNRHLSQILQTHQTQKEIKIKNPMELTGYLYTWQCWGKKLKPNLLKKK